jgi:[ribosomal protein S5]-alanine N-acetyltransferase
LALPERITSFPVVLRSFASSDAARVAELCGDPGVALTTAAVPHPYPAAAAVEWIASHREAREAGTAWTYAITRALDDVLVGAIDVRASPEPELVLGYWIGRPYWGRGYATTAVRALIAMTFLGLESDTLGATHLARNPASGRVLEKCGMTLARRECSPHRGGAPEDMCVWTITREQWSALRPA